MFLILRLFNSVPAWLQKDGIALATFRGLFIL